MICLYDLRHLMISRNESPCNIFSLMNGSSDFNGTSVGYRSVIVWPAVFAQAYPSPVDPVWGTDFPPTAMTTALASVSPVFHITFSTPIFIMYILYRTIGFNFNM